MRLDFLNIGHLHDVWGFSVTVSQLDSSRNFSSKKPLLWGWIEFGQLTKLRNDFIKVIKVTCYEIGIHWMLVILTIIECVQLTDDVFKNCISV